MGYGLFLAFFNFTEKSGNPFYLVYILQLVCDLWNGRFAKKHVSALCIEKHLIKAVFNPN